MARTTQRPVRVESHNAVLKDSERFEHPAFGMMSLTVSSYGGEGVELFGSDIPHNQVVTIRIHEATYDRSLSKDWHHAGRLLMEYEMSHAQFTHFIMSQNRGDGVPVTFRYKPAQPELEQVPGIQSIESKIDTFQAEIENSVKNKLEKFQEIGKRMKEMNEGKTISKREFSELLREFDVAVGNAPSNMAFVVKQAKKAVEHMKHELRETAEAIGDNMFRRLGEDAIKKMQGLIGHDAESSEK